MFLKSGHDDVEVSPKPNGDVDQFPQGQWNADAQQHRTGHDQAADAIAYAAEV